MTNTAKLILLPVIYLFMTGGLIAADRPNILMIVSEDNGPELGCYGISEVRTPVLDAFAEEGILFTRAYVTQAGCSPARGSIYTGLFPNQNGQVGLATWNFELYSPKIPNLVRGLKDAGYRTGIIGKLHINPAKAFPFDFAEKSTANFEREGLDEYAAFSSEFINASDKPFFLAVNYPDAHRPWIPQAEGLPVNPLTGEDVRPMPYLGVDTPDIRQIVADHYNCMERLDTLVGDLLDVLDKSGKSRNTLVIYLGDHGADMLRGKRTSYEGGVRIPFIMRWPNGFPKGQRRDEFVSIADLMPTFLELAGGKIPKVQDGQSMVSMITGKSNKWRKYLFTEFHTHAAGENFYPQRSVRNDRFKLIENLLPDEVNPGYEFAMRLSRTNADFKKALESAPAEVQSAYKLMERPIRWEFYDLEADPYEFNNLSEDPAHRKIMKELQAELKNWRVQTNDPLLDPAILNKFKQEVYSIPDKKSSKKHDWQYPYYFGRREK
ncbi:MAG: sulfatase [Puniceicoccaceae bacterium]